MKIALIGYGKMGRTIERVAHELNHEIIVRIDSEDDWIKFGAQLDHADVAIEFTTPSTVAKNIMRCFALGIPVVSGTTNWDDMKNSLKVECENTGSAIVAASNFSLGVNLFYRISNYAASLMKLFTQYDVRIEEVHHLQKLDAPSGTAKVLANNLLKIYNHKTRWVNTDTDDKNLLAISSKRLGDVTGDHTITFFSESDEIQLKHAARSRDGFAHGAILAAGWVIGKKGWFTMDDVLGELTGNDAGV